MRHTKLGELEVSVIGLGCMGMSQSYGEADRQESEETLNLALDSGVTFLDTANAYGTGKNETLLGEALKHRRKEFVLATKFGIVRHADGTRGVDGDPRRVASRCEESLKRLQTDVIDLYYLHRLDPKVPIEESVGAMADLVTAGKVRYLGLSEISAATLRRAHKVHPITAVQSEYSLWTRDPESHVLPACRELGVGFVPFSPLGRAMLSGRLDPNLSLPDDDLRKNMPRFMGENRQKNHALVQQLVNFAADSGTTASQVALAWLLAKGDGIVPIPGTKRTAFLSEDLGAAELSLNAEQLNTLDALFAADKISGDRYPPALMKSIDRD